MWGTNSHRELKNEKCGENARCRELVSGGRTVVCAYSFAAEFDANKPVNLKRIVTKIEWMNPHTSFYSDVKDDSGRVTAWAVEMGSPNGLMRAGWSRNSMKLGDVVTVDGSRAKDGSTNANARTVPLAASGQKLFAASSQGQQ